jgi:hypothetical protein
MVRHRFGHSVSLLYLINNFPSMHTCQKQQHKVHFWNSYTIIQSPYIYNKYHLSHPATISPCVQAFGWVGYINMMSEQARSDKTIFSDEIRTV